MSDEAALLAAIAAQPDEDTPRLVYADWLDEFADALPDPAAARVRAEFIRVQCQIRRLDDPFLADAGEPAVAGTSDDLWRRQEELLENHGRELLGPLAGLSYFDAILDRGFLAELDLTARMFLKHAAFVETLVPRPRVTLQNLGTDLGLLESAPAARRHLPVVTACRVRASPFQELPDNWFNRTLRLCEQFTGVTFFDLADCRLGDDDLTRFVTAPILPKLVELDLSGNELTAEGIRALVGSPLWARLRRLSVRSVRQLDDAAARVLAAAPPDRLESLSVGIRMPAGPGRTALQARFGTRLESGLVGLLD